MTYKAFVDNVIILIIAVIIINEPCPYYINKLSSITSVLK